MQLKEISGRIDERGMDRDLLVGGECEVIAALLDGSIDPPRKLGFAEQVEAERQFGKRSFRHLDANKPHVVVPCRTTVKRGGASQSQPWRWRQVCSCWSVAPSSSMPGVPSHPARPRRVRPFRMAWNRNIAAGRKGRTA